MDTSPGYHYNACEFCTHFCMSRGAFYQLWNAIKGHDVFNNGRAKKKQVSSKYQLLILLKFLGTEGDGMSNQKATAIIFPSLTGAFEVIKDQVVTAILSCLDYVYFWPKEKEKKEIAEAFEQKYFINGCIGIPDGTLLPLGFKPTREDYTDFYGRKGTYTLTMMIICDHLHRIRYYHAGWPGSVHDERVF